jgi:hypothetical protein
LKRWEWREQAKLAPLLDRWLPGDAFWTATDPYVGSAMTGWMRRLRGVRRGVPDDLIWVCGRSICIELKSPSGRCSREQREARTALLRAGAHWWECRSAHAAMWALAESNVKFREIMREDGTIERWISPSSRTGSSRVAIRPRSGLCCIPRLLRRGANVRGVGESVSGCGCGCGCGSWQVQAMTERDLLRTPWRAYPARRMKINGFSNQTMLC